MEPIAIVGMAFKFPGGAETVDDFWKMLVERRCAATEYPRDRFHIDAFWHDGITARHGHFLDGDIKNFDAGFFNMAPHEVASMDPQHRGLLENTYHAFENAGLRIEDVAKTRTSVHVGCFTSDFATMQFRDAQSIPKYNAIGTAGSMLANRISWFFDLRGESMYVDTACSSSLVALALACKGLSLGDSDMAVVGGSNLIMIPEYSVSLSNMSFLSSNGRCNSFDAKGDGYGRGEGFATLILKPVSKAVANGNPIRALIRSIGMNQDGYTSGGITQPNNDMQVQLIQETYRKAGLDMKHTRFFEAHGTGTAVGDPVEARAIGKAFFKYRTKDDPIYVGAVKSNVGHLEGTSGLAGVIKASIALERGVIPPNANFESLNPQIDADFFNLRFPTECVPWPPVAELRRASVNSFGFGGSNAHVVLEAPDAYMQVLGNRHIPHLSLSVLRHRSHSSVNGAVHFAASSNDAVDNIVTRSLANGTSSKTLKPKLLVLSSSDEHGVKRQAESLSGSYPLVRQYEGSLYSEDMLGDIIFNLNMRRTMLEWKSYCVVKSVSELADLKHFVANAYRKATPAALNLGLVFTGQGSQWPRMACELLEWPVIRGSLLRSQDFLDMMGCRWKLIDELQCEGQRSRIGSPEISQTATTAVQLALVDLIKNLGIKPSVVVGHSSGEIAAAYCAGYLCHESALRTSYFRGILSSKVANESEIRCGMASVGIAASQIPFELSQLQAKDPECFDATQITISCMNSPTNTTISGPIVLLDRIISHLSSKDLFARKLKVKLGYHSPQMDLVSAEYLKHLSNLKPHADAQGVPMVSSVQPGTVTMEMVCSGEYWVQNLVSPVRFVDAIDICVSQSSTGGVPKRLNRSHAQEIITHGWLEIGPHATLKGPLREILSTHQRSDIPYTSLLVRDKPGDVTVLEAAGQLFCRGFELSLERASRIHAVQGREPRLVVDLPKYSFNHSVVHWEESCRSRTFRSRVHGNHPLLGTQVIDWNPLDAKWRFVIKKDDIPWVSDHRLHGTIWYPAAGMVVMAVEAVKQLIPANYSDFELQNVMFMSPIIVSEAHAGTETQISVIPASKTRDRRDIDFKFRILVRRDDDSWDEACDGTIVAQRARQASGEVSQNDEEEYKRQRAWNTFKDIVESSQSSLEASEMYRKVSENTGLQYGSTFQGLADIHYDRQGHSHAKLVPLENAVVESSMPYTIHPATLDAIFQLAIPALSEGNTKILPTLVPARLTRLRISRNAADSLFASSEAAGNVVFAQSRFLSSHNAEASMTVFSKSDMQIKIEVEELDLAEVARDEAINASQKAMRAMCYEMDWKVDLGMLDQKELQEYCSQSRSPAPEPEEWYQSIKLMLLGFVREALDDMHSSKQNPIPSMEKYAGWLQARLDSYLTTRPKVPDVAYDALPSAAELERLAKYFEGTGHRGAVGVLLGRQLREVLVGAIDPLQTLFADPQYLANVYEEVNRTGKAFTMLHTYLDALVHKNPDLRFLEIGAGTGATTSMILDTIASDEIGPRYAEYVFTDVSGFFLPPAKDRFRAYDRINYVTLNAEQDIGPQGFEEGRYDIVIAAHVLHATRNLNTTLSNVRKLLKPGGKLILVEFTTPDDIYTGFVWGSLPGWWLGSESFRQQSAVVDESHWDHLLKQSCFTGAEQVFRDWDSDVCHGWSLMVSTAMSEECDAGEKSNRDWPSSPKSSLMFITRNSPCELQVETAKILQNVMEGHAMTAAPEIVTLNQLLVRADDLQARICILLYDLDRAHLHGLDPSVFQSYQRMLTEARCLLWVQMRSKDSSFPPYWSMAEGLSRVCRSENPFLRMIILTLEATENISPTDIAIKISRVLRTISSGSDTLGSITADEEQEYTEISGRLCINRLRPARYLDRHVFDRMQNATRQREFGSGFPLTLKIRVPGLLDTLEWVEDQSVYAPLQDDQVEVQVRAIGVNFKDSLTLLGRVNSDILGSECAGYVVRAGKDVNRVKVGDRVAVGHLGTYRSLLRVRETHIAIIPESMTIVEAAGIPTAFFTAYHSLHNIARLQKGETILIHAAAGGTGQAAVQLAQHIGAEIFATVGSAAKRKLLVERYGIHEDHIFYSRDTSFVDGVKRMTANKGVDVVLNSLSGKLLVASWEIIAKFGRFVEIGRKDIDTRGQLPMFPFIKNAMFAGVDIAAMVDGAGQGDTHILQEVFDLMASAIIRPSYPVQTYSISQAEQAFRLLVSGKSMGKIVLETHENAMVPVRESDDSNYRFSKEGTYVVAGGLGGIGRQITRWMVRRGASNIILLTRSGVTGSSEKSRLIQELQEQGVNFRYEICDITELKSVQEALKMATKTMPPIKGCFQSAMVIKDRTFAAMTYQEWCESVQPKVQGSWNLHTTLPSGMDFFVMLSSAVCIFGNAGQGNYAAGNTFQDALARHRVAQGEKAVAIDLGMVLGEGWLAERKHIHHRVMQFDHIFPLSQRELFSLFDYYCNPDTVYSSPAASQIITGIELPAVILHAGRQIPDFFQRPLYRAMHQIIPNGEIAAATTTKADDFVTMLIEAESPATAGTIIAEALKVKLCKILGLGAEDRTIHDRMDSFGVDSLIALEVRNWLAKEVRASLAVHEILGDVRLIDAGMAAARRSEVREAHRENRASV